MSEQEKNDKESIKIAYKYLNIQSWFTSSLVRLGFTAYQSLKVI